MPGRALSCREVVEFLADYLEEGLQAEVRAAFERHLALCVDCRRYLDGYVQAIRLGRSAYDPDDATAQAVPEELVAAILASRGAA
jgi:predicted anti-sigma-YlaC factor YlaD